MNGPPPTSIILPTRESERACWEIVEQLRPRDELLVVCDDGDDPIARHEDDLPETIRVVPAGEPERCSGKANAIAAGMESARHNRIIWTDDDFHHPDDWIQQLHVDYDRHGPTSELPFFVGGDPLAVLLEPVYALAGTAGTYLGDIAWGGAVIFERSDLPDDGQFIRDLRRTVSDDGLLTDRIEITPVKRTRQVEIGGTIRATLERHVRFTQIVRYHDPLGLVVNALGALLFAVGSVLFPLYAFFGMTATLAGVYAAFDLRRWTFLLAYSALFVSIPLLVFGLFRRTFEWGGRRYRWKSKFDVDVLT